MKIGPIEKDKVPPVNLDASIVVKTLAAMKVGDSVVVEGCDESVRSAFYRQAKRLGLFVVSRPDDKGEPERIRFWRVAEAPPRKYKATGAKP